MAMRKVLLNVSLGCTSLLLLSMQGLLAEERQKFVMTSPEEKRIIIEEVYEFTARRYEPPVEVQLLSSQDKTSYATPEDVLIAHLSAVVKGDFNWMASLKVESERKKKEELSVEERRKREEQDRYFADQLLRNKRILLMERFDVGHEVVIITFSAFSRDDGKVLVNKLPGVFTLEQGQWKMGGLSPDHPLLVNFNYDFAGSENHVPPPNIFEGKFTVSTLKPEPPFFTFTEGEER